MGDTRSGALATLDAGRVSTRAIGLPRTLIAACLLNLIRIRYVLARRQLWSYLCAADVYTIPSRREGFAVAVLEAMACGLPAVASDVPGVADALPRGEMDGGIIVPREDPGALAAGLLRLIDDPDLARRLRQVARRRMETDFSVQAIGPRLRRLFLPGDVSNDGR